MQNITRKLEELIESPWPIYIYFIVTACESVEAIFRLQWKDGFSAIIDGSLALMAGGLLKTSLFYGDAFKKIFGSIMAVALLAAAHYWTSYDYSINIFGHIVDGVVWCYVGAALGFLFTNKKTADIDDE